MRSVRPLGETALLVTLAVGESPSALAAGVREKGLVGVGEIVAGLHSLTVELDPDRADRDELASALSRLPARPRSAGRVRTVVVPTAFDGPDLAEVGDRTGLGAQGVVASLTAARLEVQAIGFSPGFAYLSGLPPVLRDVPRRDEPRPSVPAGSVAVAGGYAAVYPQATPGGWQLLGRTAHRLFDPATPPYALLRPGDVVRFRPVGAVDPGPPDGPAGRRLRSPWRSPSRTAAFVVEDPGPLSIVEDAGRAGVCHLGIPRAGPADPDSHELANRLVGNTPGAAALEMTVSGVVLRCQAPSLVAAVGGGVAVSLDGLDVPTGHVVPVYPGQRLVVGRPAWSSRCYLAVAGGWVVPEQLGSPSTDTLAWLGPGRLVAGDELGAGEVPGPPADHLGWSTPGQAPPAAPRRLRLVLGPHHEWFPPDVGNQLAARRFVVDADSDRVGLRLHVADGGPLPRETGELASQGVVTGAVQVPPGGDPVVLLPDHATLGGYPVVGVVVRADLGELGRCRVGEEVVLVPVSGAEAARAWTAHRRSMEEAVVGRYPLATS